MDTSVCLHPVYVYGTPFPCGKCPVCRMKYRKQMAIRFYMEKCIDKPKYGYFLTLTYDEANVPQIDGRFCFCKDHVVTFLDSLRHKLRERDLSLRYFLTCEYGEEGYRSHYHLICLLYGSGSFRSKHEFNQEFCQKLWHYGYTYDGNLTPYSILYCTSYALKDDEYLERDWSDFPEGRPFRLFSMRPGLGLSDNCVNWWSNFVYNDGDIRSGIHLRLQKGNLSTGVPVGVKRKIKDTYPDIYESLKEANSRYLQESRDLLFENIERYGASSVYERANSYTPDMLLKDFDSTPDDEIKAFRKALRQLGKSKRNPLK